MARFTNDSIVVTAPFAGLLWLSASVISFAADPAFTPVQPGLFSDPGGQSNAWGDYDNDGDLDLIITFRDAPVRLYRNSPDGFEDVGAGAGLVLEFGVVERCPAARPPDDELFARSVGAVVEDDDDPSRQVPLHGADLVAHFRFELV